MRLLTWNLFGLELTRRGPRMEAACLEMLLGTSLKDALAGKKGPPAPHLICLQEVVRIVHLGQLRPHFAAAGYTLFPVEPSREEGNEYSVIAVRKPLTVASAVRRRFRLSDLGRHYLEVVVAKDDGPFVRVLTAHMESLRSGRDCRVDQAKEIDDRLHADELPGVFAGDANMRDEEWAELRRGGFRGQDVFEAMGAPPTKRLTWWPWDGKKAGRRYDRIWTSQQGIESVGFDVRRRDEISDHAAVQAELLIRR